MAETPVGRVSGWTTSTPLGILVRRAAWPLSVVAVLVLAGFLRFSGTGWDVPDGSSIPLQMHPDERFISIVNEKISWPGSVSEYFDTASSPLNPYNQAETPSFVYGTFPVFVAKAVATAAESDVPALSEAAGLLCEGDGYDTTVMCGRRLTALADTLTVALVVCLALVIANRLTALVAGLLYACAVLPAQISHFWTVDPWVVFFGAATALLSVLWMMDGRSQRSGGNTLAAGEGDWRAIARSALIVAALGACVGLGLASKVTAWPLLLGPILAPAVRIGFRDVPRLGLRIRGDRWQIRGHWSYDIVGLSAALVIALVVFRIAQPYAFAGPDFWDMAINPQWRADIEREIDFQNGNVDFPPFVQFAGRTPFLWPLQNLALWGLGPALAIAGAAGLLMSAIGLFRKREMAWLIPLAMTLAVIGFQGPRFVAFMRYFAPAYPFICLFAAAAIAAALTWGLRGGVPLWRRDSNETGTRPGGTRRIEAVRLAAIAGALLVPALTLWWALAFQSIFRAEHPRIAASEWMYANIPAGSGVTTEIWDDALPYPLPGQPAGAFELISTYPFDTDSVAKVTALVYGSQGPNASAGLNGADYVVVASGRARDAIVQLEREYPATIRYYELLDSGALGFELVATFTSRPTFLGISVDDSGAEESFTVYDHPEVRIYRKTADWDPLVAINLLLEAHPERAVNLLPRQGGTNGLRFTAAQQAEVDASGTFDDVFDADGLFSRGTWIWWLVWIEVLAFATLPWLSLLFRRLPDRGFGISKLAGFAVTGLLTWLIVAWGITTFSAGLVWVVALSVAASGVAVGVSRRHDLLSDVRARWPVWLACELVFLATFGAFLAMRFNLPDLWHNYQGGEKPVELAFLTAITRSSIMPPYDPWFAGGTMNYYYMGWFLVAVPMKAMRILPEIGFNLALPTYAAIAAAVAFSTGSNLVALGRRATGRFRPGPAIVGGLIAAALFIALGNLDSAHQTIERFQSLNLAGFDPAGQPIYHWDLFSDIPVLGGMVGFVSGINQWLFEDGILPPFDWWRASRVHAPQYDITEFPYFSFLFGDLHAHLMAFPFFGLVIALCLGYFLTSDRDGRRTWAIAAAMGIAIGLVRTVHTWDFPTATLLIGATIAAAQLLRSARWQTRTWDGIGHFALVLGVLVVLFAPYTQHNEVTETGLVLARETTKANQYFAHFGLFVVVTVAFLAVRYYEELRKRDGVAGSNVFLAAVAGRWEVISLAMFVIGLSAFTWRWGLTTIALSVMLLLFLANLLWLEYRALERNRPRIFATAMFAAAVGIAGGVDIVQVEYDIVRMNTVFKFSLQAWQLYAIASAYGVYYVGSALASFDGWRISVPAPRRAAALASLSIFVGLVLAAAIYPWAGTRARMESRFAGSPSGTLDGLAYLPYGYFAEDKANDDPSDDVLMSLGDDEPLIRWLRANVEGSPVIAEAVGPLYHWTSRISWNTGLPTVVGWDWHQVAYRTDYELDVQQRRLATSVFFTDPSVGFANDYLREYDVSYVVVGTTERVFGTPEGLAKFDHMATLDVVFRDGDYAIYRVDKEALGPATIVSQLP